MACRHSEYPTTKPLEKGAPSVSNNETTVEEYPIGETKKEEVKKGITVRLTSLLYNMLGNTDKSKTKPDLPVLYDTIPAGTA